MEKEIFILGVGNNTPVYIDLAESCGYKVKGFYHYDNTRTGEYDHGFEILGSNDDLFAMQDLSGMNFAVSMGNNKLRVELSEKIREKNGCLPALIHPTAVVSRFTKIGHGVVIHINTVIQADTEIGDYTVFSYNTALSHTSSIGKGCYVAGGAEIGAYTKIEDFVFIGQCAVTISSKVPSIGQGAIIGAGAVVIRPVDENTVVAGSPARILTK